MKSKNELCEWHFKESGQLKTSCRKKSIFTATYKRLLSTDENFKKCPKYGRKIIILMGTDTDTGY